jgi:thiosulfate reductase cytochrome b subunit
VIVSGLALSPGMDAAWPWLTAIFGGRQSARSVHFLAMAAILAFLLVHVTLVLLAGPINELRSMITGWWRVPGEERP